MRIYLFDIDGTLISTSGAGKRAMETGFTRLFARSASLDGVLLSGRTDRTIAREFFEKHGVRDFEAHWDIFREAYLAALPGSLQHSTGRVLPGVVDLLERLRHRSDSLLGLLTGNVREGARHKLEHYGLWRYFSFGGFGDDHADRSDVARAALLAAAQHLGGDWNRDAVFVIGDTPLDISCARAIGAKAVAVASGHYSREFLARHDPDFLIESLVDFPE